MLFSFAKECPLLIYFLVFSFGHFLPAQTSLPKQEYVSQFIQDIESPLIDGQLNDKVWQELTWNSDFVQREPVENAPPTEASSFAIFYDAKHLYIGIRNHDSQPDLISQRMSRRDQLDGDWVAVEFDSFHDLRSSFSFSITAAGVKGDKTIVLNGLEEDPTWNPIWYANTQITEQGWTAEMKIPLSQLRFGKDADRVWGLQVIRKLFRQEELSVWQRVPIDAAGWVSEYGKLKGLESLSLRKPIEIQPFVLTSLNHLPADGAGSKPFSEQVSLNAGLDGKIGLSNNLTLDFTINPDFGQVEADPSAIALDGFQLFFQEQRPFFVENKNIFNYQFSSPIIGGPFSSDNLFYSRRIGRSPQGMYSLQGETLIQAPGRTTILGAAKVSGKTKNGWSIGILESLTANEFASFIDSNGSSIRKVEPLSNYFVGRVQKDLNQKRTFIGGIVTSTIRKLEPELDFLHRTATTAGLDVFHQWKERSWYASANLVMSHVEGNEAAILRTQTAIPHLFQRKDAPHLHLDSSRTSLTGTGGDLKIGKSGNGHLNFETGLTWRSPELELNDLGFMREADDIQQYTGIRYRSLQPFGIFRKAELAYQHWIKGNFARQLNYFDWDVEASGTLNNNWQGRLGFFSQPHIYSTSLLQGGPRIYLPDQYGSWWSISSDKRQAMAVEFSGWTKTGNADSYYLLESGITLSYQPLNQLSVSLSPMMTTIKHRLQFTAATTFNAQNRHIVSRLDQSTLRMGIRLNYAINPNLSIQYYAQPFISTGKYNDFGYIIQPLAKSQSEQIHFYSAEQMVPDASGQSFFVSETEIGQVDYSFENPDFSFAQFRSNLVVRFEYKAGSELYLVWSQDGSNYKSWGELGDRFRQQILQHRYPHTFLLKFTYRFL